jgi:long-subunit fatty acid transport protein
MFPSPRILCGAFGLLLAAGASPLAAQSVYDLIAEQSRTAFTVQGAGARAMGTGGAFIAVADDATAVSFNPAGLAQLLQPEVSMSGQAFTRQERLLGFSSQNPLDPTTLENSSSTDHWSGPSFFSFTLPWKHDAHNWTFQLSYQRIFDFRLCADRTFTATPTGGGSPGTITQLVNQKGGVDLYSIGLGGELSSRILAGASINVWNGAWSFGSLSRRVDSGTDTFDSLISQSNAFRGLNANLGLIWRLDWLKLGLVYRSPFNAQYTTSDAYTSTDPQTGLLDQTSTPSQVLTIRWPETFGYGLAVRPMPRLLLTTDWSYTPWSRTTFAPSGSPYDQLNFFDLLINTRTPNVTDWHAGTEWVAWLGDSVVVPIRAGCFREPQPIVDTQTGAQRVYRGWTAGFGIKMGAWTLDAAFKETRSERYASRLDADAPTGGVVTYALGTEELDEHRVFLSLICQLDGEKVRRALGWLVGD